MYNRLKKIENLKLNKPKGGMNLWVELPYEITGEAVYMKLLRRGVGILPEKIATSVLGGKYSSDISNSGLNQRVFQYFLEEGIWEKHIERSRKEFKRKQMYMYNRLKK